jgi:peptide/nickel transport system permease protein
MTRYLVGRTLQAIAVLFIVTIIVFAILHFLPGSPARAMLGIHATPAAISQFNAANGYNRPLPVQYVLYLGRLVHGNLGFSYHYDQSVGSLLALDLPKSALLVGASYVIALLIAIPMGIVQALRRNNVVDHMLTGFSFVGYAMPTFWLGVLLLVAFSAELHLFPSEGPQGATVSAALSDPSGLVLPVATLTIVTVAQFSRFMRSSAIEVLLQDYIRTARAAGASRFQLVTRHVLRNSLLPIITLIGISLPGVLSGAVVVEALFNYPGMGWLFWTASGTHDYPVLMGFTVVVAVATVLGNLLADIAYAAADPRIRYGAS